MDQIKLLDLVHARWTPSAGLLQTVSDLVIPLHGELGGYAVNGYLLYDAEQREAVLVDTASAPDMVLTTLAQHRLRLTAILATHGHADHVGGASVIHRRTRAPLRLHPADAGFVGERLSVTPLTTPATLSVGRSAIEVHEAPGHTLGGLMFAVHQGSTHPGVVFTGDTLFAGSLGRCATPTLYPGLLEVVRKTLLTLPEDTILLPGHGPPTTVGTERRHNPFFPSM